jgi:hypothetical protein
MEEGLFHAPRDELPLGKARLNLSDQDFHRQLQSFALAKAKLKQNNKIAQRSGALISPRAASMGQNAEDIMHANIEAAKVMRPEASPRAGRHDGPSPHAEYLKRVERRQDLYRGAYGRGGNAARQLSPPKVDWNVRTNTLVGTTTFGGAPPGEESPSVPPPRSPMPAQAESDRNSCVQLPLETRLHNASIYNRGRERNQLGSRYSPRSLRLAEQADTLVHRRPPADTCRAAHTTIDLYHARPPAPATDRSPTRADKTAESLDSPLLSPEKQLPLAHATESRWGSKKTAQTWVMGDGPLPRGMQPALRPSTNGLSRIHAMSDYAAAQARGSPGSLVMDPEGNAREQFRKHQERLARMPEAAVSSLYPVGQSVLYYKNDGKGLPAKRDGRAAVTDAKASASTVMGIVDGSAPYMPPRFGKGVPEHRSEELRSLADLDGGPAIFQSPPPPRAASGVRTLLEPMQHVDRTRLEPTSLYATQMASRVFPYSPRGLTSTSQVAEVIFHHPPPGHTLHQVDLHMPKVKKQDDAFFNPRR